MMASEKVCMNHIFIRQMYRCDRLHRLIKFVLILRKLRWYSRRHNVHNQV